MLRASVIENITDALVIFALWQVIFVLRRVILPIGSFIRLAASLEKFTFKNINKTFLDCSRKVLFRFRLNEHAHRAVLVAKAFIAYFIDDKQSSAALVVYV